MSSAPPGILALDSYLRRMLGDEFSAGIVGDSNHKTGYHLGPDRTPPGDYSERLTRDRRGAASFPVYASAIDIDMGWPGSRQWLAALVLGSRNGAAHTRDIREIIGSLNGQRVLYWDSQTGFSAVGYTGADHVTHTHISFFRDSANRDQSDVLRTYLEPSQLQQQEDDMPSGEVKQGFAYDEQGNLLDQSLITSVTLPFGDWEWLHVTGDLEQVTVRVATQHADGWYDVNVREIYPGNRREASSWKLPDLQTGKVEIGRMRTTVKAATAPLSWSVTPKR